MLKFYVVTHRSEDSACWHWALTLSPTIEDPMSAAKSTMWCQILDDVCNGVQGYRQEYVRSFAPTEAVARILVGWVPPTRRLALERLIASTRHRKAGTSSEEWVRAVLTLLLSTPGKVITDEPVDPHVALRLLDKFSNEVVCGVHPSPGTGLPFTTYYSP
ncbi:predicted protein [Postia placenta Mad-698-R]|nr:predicted protein [Postia placenta Mad-698-R]